MDYLGNKTKYYKLLLSDFEKEFNVKLKPISSNDVSNLIGAWELKGHNFSSQDTLVINKEQKIEKSNMYQYFKIPKDGILSLWSHYDADPDYDLEEGYEECAFYAHWINDKTLHLSNPDSSLQWLLIQQP